MVVFTKNSTSSCFCIKKKSHSELCITGLFVRESVIRVIGKVSSLLLRWIMQAYSSVSKLQLNKTFFLPWWRLSEGMGVNFLLQSVGKIYHYHPSFISPWMLLANKNCQWTGCVKWRQAPWRLYQTYFEMKSAYMIKISTRCGPITCQHTAKKSPRHCFSNVYIYGEYMITFVCCWLQCKKANAHFNLYQEARVSFFL